MSDWSGIDLRNRKLLHPPWNLPEDGFDKFVNHKVVYPMPSSTIIEMIESYLNRKGSLDELVSLLNNHMTSRKYTQKAEDLLNLNCRYSLEYYFYILQFCKFLLDDNTFPYSPDQTIQQDENRYILEQGPLHCPPWKLENTPSTGYLSIANMRAMFSYVEESYLLPEGYDRVDNIGKKLSTEALIYLNRCAPPEYRIERSFIDKEGILISFEYLFYISSIFELLTNNLNFTFDSLHYGFAHNSQLARAIFLQPGISPLEGLQQWVVRTNNLYDLEIGQKDRSLNIRVNLKKQFESGMYSIYQKNCQKRVMQACPAVYCAFIELITKDKTKFRVIRDKKNPLIFSIIIKWKRNFPVFRIAFFGLLSGLSAMFLSLCIMRISGNLSPFAVIGIMSLITAGGLSALYLYWKTRYRKMESQVAESRTLINRQLDSLKTISDEILKERNTLHEKVRERTEELETALKQLKELDKSKTNFIANVSHELRTPLTLLSVPLEEIQNGCYGLNIAADAPVISILQRNVERLQTQINQLLDFSRLNLGTHPFRPGRISLISYCRDLAAELESLAENKNLFLIVDNRTGQNRLDIEADETLLETVMLNLLNNAIKFTDRGGIEIILEKSQDCSNVILSVKDSGIGFSMNEKKRIFQRFTQAEEHRERHHEGAGIGLALIREISRLHSWDLDAYSHPGEGAVFSLTIPVLTEIIPDRPQIPQKHNRRERAVSGIYLPEDSPTFSNTAVSGESILLVEDNPDMATILHHILKDTYSFHWCRSGFDAMDWLQPSRDISLIICDVMMPGMSGFTFRKKCLAREEYRDLPFIFLTALADSDVRLEALESGALDYIQKPFSGRELTVKIQNLLSNRKSGYLKALQDSAGTERLIRMTQLDSRQTSSPSWDEMGITKAEIRVIDLLKKGLQDKEIAAKLIISPRTVSTHLRNLYRKTNSQNRIELLNILYGSNST